MVEKTDGETQVEANLISDQKEISFSTYYDVIAYELRASIRRYFELWESLFWKGQQQNPMCLFDVERKRLPIIVLSCTLLECAINFYLSTKLSSEQFKEISRDKTVIKFGKLFGKWVLAPGKILQKYEVPDHLKEHLRKLINRRNAIIHSTPMISIDGDNRHKGNEPEIELDEHIFVGHCSVLPSLLVENITASDPKSWSNLSSLSLSCGIVASEFTNGDAKYNRHISTPRELIQEIADQGHKWDDAVFYAMMVLIRIQTNAGSLINEKGLIELWPRIGKKIELKPLKFLEKQKQSTPDNQPAELQRLP